MYNKRVKIENLEIGNIFLAPMAGVTDVAFRHVCKLCGADLTYTEMVSVKALEYNNQKTLNLLYTSDIEKPKAVQIFGHDEKVMAYVCEQEYMQKFDLIDINFGCPAPKIVNNGDGSALLKDLNKCATIISECSKHSPKPITCKFRIGYHANENIAVDMAKVCEDNGAKMITVHGRTKSQMYSGEVDLDTIANVKANVKIRVVGNGDVTDLNSYNKMLSTGVDAVMIGRGALGNPEIFSILKNKQPQNKLELIYQQYKVLKEFYSDNYINANFKKHLLWYLAGIDNATKIKQQIAINTNVEDSIKLIEGILK